MRHCVAAFFALLTLVAAGCGSGDDRTAEERAEQMRPVDGARLRALGLTRRIPRQVRQACAEARRLAKTPVVCPRLIPDIPLTRIEGLWGSIVFDAEPRLYMLNFNNAGGFFNRPLRGVEHWIAGGGAADAVEKWILTDVGNEAKGDPELVRTETLRGRRVRIYRFPPYPAGGPNGSHVGAFVRVDSRLVFASLHGSRYAEAAAQMAADLAEHASFPNARSPRSSQTTATSSSTSR